MAFPQCYLKTILSSLRKSLDSRTQNLPHILKSKTNQMQFLLNSVTTSAPLPTPTWKRSHLLKVQLSSEYMYYRSSASRKSCHLTLWFFYWVGQKVGSVLSKNKRRIWAHLILLQFSTLKKSPGRLTSTLNKNPEYFPQDVNITFFTHKHSTVL